MFKDLVRSLPIGKEFTGLSIRDPYEVFPELELDCREWNPERALAEYITVEDIGKEWPIAHYYDPSFGVRGDYLYGNQFNKLFRINPEGKHILFFTGKPKEDNNPIFRFKPSDTIYRYYWEDNRVGYLTQVIEIKP